MTPDQARELEQRLRARGLSRKASRDAVACVREWIAEQPHDVDVEVAAAMAQTLLRDLARATHGR